MKIGIMTFHWATNYGAVLQAYCLQEYLREQGHDVEIINYKPMQYDFSWKKILRHPGMLRIIRKLLINNKKESQLISFRIERLNMTERFYFNNELSKLTNLYDVVITGSDQILNASFATKGENGHPSSAYFLSFASHNCKKIGYAVSFGCSAYPDKAKTIVQPWIQQLDSISVREDTGMDILEDFAYQGYKQVVPDPTILLGKQLYDKLSIEIPLEKEDYICVYMLRRRIKINGNVKYIDEWHEPLSMEQWLYTISHAKKLITNSYHGMIMAILAHVPFVAIVETGKGVGMNDRFLTLLNKLGLEDRIATSIAEVELLFNREINFKEIDNALEKYQKVGVEYIKRELSM